MQAAFFRAQLRLHMQLDQLRKELLRPNVVSELLQNQTLQKCCIGGKQLLIETFRPRSVVTESQRDHRTKQGNPTIVGNVLTLLSPSSLFYISYVKVTIDICRFGALEVWSTPTILLRNHIFETILFSHNFLNLCSQQIDICSQRTTFNHHYKKLFLQCDQPLVCVAERSGGLIPFQIRN